MTIPNPWRVLSNSIKYLKYGYVHCQCIPTFGINWCQFISNRMSMHLAQKYFSTRGIKQMPVFSKINHHGHYPCYCWRNCGISLINQCTLCEILDEMYLWPLASFILKDASTYVNASAIHTRIYIYIYIKNNAWVTVNNDFWVTSEAICQYLFTGDEVTSENHWQIASRVTRKSLFTVTNVSFYFLHVIWCPEHSIPPKQLSITNFAVVANGSLFWLSIFVKSPQLICDVTRM